MTIKEMILQNIDTFEHNNIDNDKGVTLAIVYWYDHGCILLIDPDINESSTEDDRRVILRAVDRIKSAKDLHGGEYSITDYDHKLGNDVCSILFQWKVSTYDMVNPLNLMISKFDKSVENIDLQKLTEYLIYNVLD